MGNKATVLALAATLALPAAGLAQQSNNTGQHEQSVSHSATSPHETVNNQRATTETAAAQHSHANMPRGSGPEAMPATERARFIRDAAPRFVTVETELLAARDTSQGLSRMMADAGSEMTPEYSEHVGVLTSAIDTNLTTARRHLDQLRGSIETMGMMDRFSNDFYQAEQGLNQARQTLSTIATNRQAQNVPPSEIRSEARVVTNRIDAAHAAVQRIEHGLGRS